MPPLQPETYLKKEENKNILKHSPMLNQLRKLI